MHRNLKKKGGEGGLKYFSDICLRNFKLLYKTVYSQNHDPITCQVMGNQDSYGLASQASAEYAQEDDETFRAALQNDLLEKT